MQSPWVGFDVTIRTRLGATLHEALRSGRQHVSGIGDGRAHVTDEQPQSGQQALYEAGGVGTVAGRLHEERAEFVVGR